MSDEFALDPQFVRRSFEAVSATFDANSAVHAAIRAQLLERLDVVRIEPAVVVDLGAGTAHASRALKDRYRSAQVIAADIAPKMLAQAARQQRLLRRFARVATDAHRLALRTASVDMVFSNLMLQWSHDPDTVFNEVRRVLKPNGLFTFTALGPDSLRELRSAWSQIDTYTHVHRFIDMHDLGDALLRAGFAEPVMDTQRLTVTYPTFDAFLGELAGSGSGNVAQGRRHGLTAPAALDRVRKSYEQLRREGTLPVSLEIVFGHAWTGNLARAVSSGEVRVPVASLRRRGVDH
ncbi:MAG TPA: methyltransferase domain-containing protein [Steroidobacteraceae bacterium]